MTEAKQVLIDWTNGQSGWVKLIVKEILDTGTAIPEDNLEEIYNKNFLIEKELAPGQPPLIEDLNFLEKTGTLAEALFLRHIHDVTHVNKLAAGQNIKFNKGITLIFGENASGKSGYVRILKRLAATRSQEEILPDVTLPTHHHQPKANISYGIGDKEFTCDWKGETGVVPFNRISIFDSRALISHVDESLTYVYTPRDLSLFKLVHTALEWMRNRLDTERKKIKPSNNPFLASFSKDSGIYSKIETLGPASDLRDLEASAQFGPDDEALIEPLKEQIEALNPQLVASKLEGAESRRSILTQGMELATLARSFDWNRHNELITELAMAKENYTTATDKVFIGNDTSGVLTESWKKFIEAGDNFLKENNAGKYPGHSEPCIYCQQPLESAAVDLVNKFKSYCNNSLKKDVQDIEKKIRDLSLKFDYPDLEIYTKTLQRKLGNTQSQNTELLKLKLQFALLCRDTLKELSQFNEIAFQEVTAQADKILEECNKLLSPTEELITALRKQGEERRVALTAGLPKLKNLEARKTLKSLFPEVKRYVEDSKWASKAESINNSISTLLRSLTAQTKIASEDLLNKDFQKYFEQECRELRAPKVKLDFPGQRGEAARKKSLGARYRLSDILSEGEQKVIALADFLAETSIRNSPSPLVFDDPVNSLDHKRIEYIADRIDQLSRDQQVIVFTHNIWFATSLLARFEDEIERCTYYDMADASGTPGFITSGSHPRWDTVSKLNGRINSLIQTASSSAVEGEAKQALIENTYGILRSWCEVVVEQELLFKVAQRYTPHIMMGGLSKIKYNRLEAAIVVVQEIFAKCCRIMPGHSQPLETLAIRATIEELKQDWQSAQDALKAYQKN
jgi:energy-coupling factor transporter ATP-binding protein EcfA2